MIDGGIFDVDGTILDSMPLWMDLGARYLRTQGIEPEPELGEILQTMTTEQAAWYCREHYGLKQSAAEFDRGVTRLLEQSYFHEIPLKPGVSALLWALREEDVPLCIATASDSYLVQVALDRCGVLDCFSEILTCAQVRRGKDHPAIYERALFRLGTDRSRTVVFEDAFHAARTASEAGFPVVGIYDPSEPHPQAMENLCSCYVRDWTQRKTLDAFLQAL